MGLFLFYLFYISCFGSPSTCVHVEGLERKRSKCLSVKKHLVLFRSHLMMYSVVIPLVKHLSYIIHFSLKAITRGESKKV